jgi:hypothetical protein
LTTLAFALAKMPPDMNRVIVEFLLGVVPTLGAPPLA